MELHLCSPGETTKKINKRFILNNENWAFSLWGKNRGKNDSVLKEKEGSSLFVNMSTGKRIPILRHAELGDIFCNEICTQLGISKIK